MGNSTLKKLNTYEQLNNVLNDITIEYIFLNWIERTYKTYRIYNVLRSYHIDTVYKALNTSLNKMANLRNFGIKGLSLMLVTLDDYLKSYYSVTLEEYEQNLVSLSKDKKMTKDNLIRYGIGDCYVIQENWKYERIKNLNKMFL